MEKRKIRTTTILLIILISLFTLQFTQYQFSWIKLKPLDGYYIDTEKVKFSWKDWFSGAYQEKEDKYLTEHFGFRSFFIRLNHQFRFSLFDVAKTQWVTVGKDFYLYEESYIKAWYGTDFVGRDSIEHRMYKLKYLQDTLEQLGTNVIMILAPGKGSFFPEYIPEQFHQERTTTNIEIYREYVEKWNINCIDFNQYFIDNKDKSQYPLYPQYDVHWSFYGMCLVGDSIVRYIERIDSIKMPHMYWEKIRIGQPPAEYDRGISKAMNLLFEPRTYNMAYPELLFESDSGKTKPSLLVIADSFYWGIFGMGWAGNLFTDNHFWYYNKEIYPSDPPLTTEDINLKEEILKNDIIIILATDANLPNFGWGFIEKGYNLFY
jgi:hypothetical protein